MATSGGNPGISRLAKAISDRTKVVVDDADVPALEFGQIQKDLGLLTNTFPKKIPKGSYSVLRHVGGQSMETDVVNDHSHNVAMPKLQEGDHVLVAWVGNSAVVLDVIVSSGKL